MNKAWRLSERITEYLAAGGLFNPEMMDHDKVSRLLIDCRAALDEIVSTDLFSACDSKGCDDQTAKSNPSVKTHMVK